ncbi:ser/thr protein phosphatase superfamily [Anaeramoeba flamelloides]|uniref:Ser/thr protein phosphatase superfamily n=1 Tax=Anaeramoeba flamelloides TaxID=1746091 RepID=A0AAV7ZGV3_9EUKA|nr:ser/thr protein phosphatase superfamily [Anaeramoeba flamelloides]
MSEEIETNTLFEEKETIKVQIISDTHLEMVNTSIEEYTQEVLQPNGDVLAIAGDLGDPFRDSYQQFLSIVSKQFKLVLVIAGNHEFYRGLRFDKNKKSLKKTVPSTIKQIKEVVGAFDNVRFLNNDSLILKLKKKNVRVLGTVLWSEIPSEAMIAVGNGLNDYSFIYIDEGERMLVYDAQDMFAKNLKWLVSQVNESTQSKNEECLVLSHHCPTMLGTSPPKFRCSLTTHGFSSNLESLFIEKKLEKQQKMGLKKKSNIKTWICGHTHWNFDFNVKGTRVVSNQTGYCFEDSCRYNPKFSIDL